ncbi:MAG: hypothetical protein ACK5V3_00320, partial [Bdellovibrionales bacterium]
MSKVAIQLFLLVALLNSISETALSMTCRETTQNYPGYYTSDKSERNIPGNSTLGRIANGKIQFVRDLYKKIEELEVEIQTNEQLREKAKLERVWIRDWPLIRWATLGLSSTEGYQNLSKYDREVKRLKSILKNTQRRVKEADDSQIFSTRNARLLEYLPRALTPAIKKALILNANEELISVHLVKVESAKVDLKNTDSIKSLDNLDIKVWVDVIISEQSQPIRIALELLLNSQVNRVSEIKIVEDSLLSAEDYQRILAGYVFSANLKGETKSFRPHTKIQKFAQEMELSLDLRVIHNIQRRAFENPALNNQISTIMLVAKSSKTKPSSEFLTSYLEYMGNNEANFTNFMIPPNHWMIYQLLQTHEMQGYVAEAFNFVSNKIRIGEQTSLFDLQKRLESVPAQFVNPYFKLITPSGNEADWVKMITSMDMQDLTK